MKTFFKQLKRILLMPVALLIGVLAFFAMGISAWIENHKNRHD